MVRYWQGFFGCRKAWLIRSIWGGKSACSNHATRTRPGYVKNKLPPSQLNKGKTSLAFKDREEQRAYGRAWYAANKEKTVARARANSQRYRARNKKYVDDLRSATPCTDCGNSYPPYVMDFDHLDGEEKFRNVADMVGRAVSLELLQLEIAKCEIVCANCHRERTYQRRQHDPLIQP